jgi:capsular polysaccharide transport system permease protein
MKLLLRRHWLFVVMVLAPMLGAILYYGLIASDVYVSESRFLVRNSQHQSSSGLVGDLLQSTGLGGHS